MANDLRLIVFDWDGTLMDSVARIVACIRAAITDLAFEPRDDATIRDIIGLGLREAIETLYPGCDERLHRDLTDRYRHHFLEADPTPSQLFAGAAETVARLHGAGYRLAVATGKGRRGLDKALRETGLGRYFHATRCADETRSKPDPRMLLELMDELDITAAETLMVGDTEYDMQMAHNAGTGALAVSYGVHAVERLHRHDPLGCIDDIRECCPWLGVEPDARPRQCTA